MRVGYLSQTIGMGVRTFEANDVWVLFSPERGTENNRMGEPFLIENLDVYKILAPEEVMMMTDAYTIPAEWKVSGTGRDF